MLHAVMKEGYLVHGIYMGLELLIQNQKQQWHMLLGMVMGALDNYLQVY